MDQEIEVQGENGLRYIANPNTSLAADITSHIKNTAEQYPAGNQGNIQFLMQNKSKIEYIQEV